MPLPHHPLGESAICGQRPTDPPENREKNQGPPAHPVPRVAEATKVWSENYAPRHKEAETKRSILFNIVFGIHTGEFLKIYRKRGMNFILRMLTFLISDKGRFCQARSLCFSVWSNGVTFSGVKSETELDIWIPKYLTLSTHCNGQFSRTHKVGKGALSGRTWDLLQFTLSPENTANVLNIERATDNEMSESWRKRTISSAYRAVFSTRLPTWMPFIPGEALKAAANGSLM